MERRKRIKSTSEGNNLKMLKTQEVWIEGHIVWARLNTNNWWPGNNVIFKYNYIIA